MIVNAANAIMPITDITMPDVQPANELNWLCHVTNPQVANNSPSRTRTIPITVNGHNNSVKSTAEKSRSLMARLIKAGP